MLTHRYRHVTVSDMQTYTKEQVLSELRGLVTKSNTARVAAELGVVPQLVSMVLLGQRKISDGLALKLGFVKVKMPDRYMREPKPAKKQ